MSSLWKLYFRFISVGFLGMNTKTYRNLGNRSMSSHDELHGHVAMPDMSSCGRLFDSDGHGTDTRYRVD